MRLIDAFLCLPELNPGLALLDAEKLVELRVRLEPNVLTGPSRMTVSCVCSPVNTTVRNVELSFVTFSMSSIQPSMKLLSRA